MKSNEFKLLVTNKYYRKMKLEKIKIDIISLPGIKDIIAWYRVYKMRKKMQGKNNWEQYVAIRNAESDSQKFCFAQSLIRLQAVIMAHNIDKEMFYQAKNDVLSYDIINETNMREFKEWVENINHEETDYSKVQELLKSLTQHKQ